MDEKHHRPLVHTSVTASLLPARCPFDVFKQFIFVIISKRRRTAIKRASCTLSAEGPSQTATLHSLFYFISLGFWLMSVTATGNKMLVRVCVVASERRLWYIVRPFASVSWLPRHRLHVYWLGVNKARASTYFSPSLPLQKVRLPLMWKRYIVKQHKRMCCKVSFAPSPLFCIVCAVHCWAVTLIVIVGNKLKV